MSQCNKNKVQPDCAATSNWSIGLRYQVQYISRGEIKYPGSRNNQQTLAMRLNRIF